MGLPPFLLERYFAQHEFSAPYPLCSSDMESMTIGDLLNFEPGAFERLSRMGLGYTESLGHPELRRAIAAEYNGIGPQNILVHAGAEEAIFGFMNSVLVAGDEIVVHWPCYQSLFQVAETLGCAVRRWEADEKNGWALSLDALQGLVSKKTRAVVLNCPHNPTGYLMDRRQFVELVQICRDRGIILFVDEVYRGLEYDGAERLPAVVEISESAVSLGVMSKSFGLPGLRIGWVATRNQSVFSRMEAFKDYTSICNSAPSEFLATLALKHRERILYRNLNIIRENLALIDSFMERFKNRISWNRPRAGCIGFVRLSGGGADAFCESALKSRGVLLAPSRHFGFGDRHFRIGFGRVAFPQGLERLERFFAQAN